MKRQTRKNRILAFALAACLLAVLGLSALFIVTHARHDCTGSGCEVCYELEACASTIRHLSEALTTGAAVSLGLLLLLLLDTPLAAEENRRPATPVFLKVRLNI